MRTVPMMPKAHVVKQMLDPKGFRVEEYINFKPEIDVEGFVVAVADGFITIEQGKGPYASLHQITAQHFIPFHSSLK